MRTGSSLDAAFVYFFLFRPFSASSFLALTRHIAPEARIGTVFFLVFINPLFASVPFSRLRPTALLALP